MPKERSINQNNISDALPNFRNLGVVLRIVLIVNGLAIFVAMTQAASIQDLGQRLLFGSAYLQPVLISCLLILYILKDILRRLDYRQGWGAVLY